MTEMQLCRKKKSRGSLRRREGKAENTGQHNAMTWEESSNARDWESGNKFLERAPGAFGSMGEELKKKEQTQ